MTRQKPNDKGYFHCQGDDCDFKSKNCSRMIYFKARLLCHHCKLKYSKCIINVDLLPPTDAMLQRYTRIPEARHMPRERFKDYTKVRPELKEWAEHQESKNSSSQAKETLPEGSNKVMWVGLSKQERQRLWAHFFKQGMDSVEILREIEKIKQQITFAHNQYKNGLKTKESFKEEFNKMVNK